LNTETQKTSEILSHQIKLRRADANDAKSLAALVRRSFCETFTHFQPEPLQNFLEEHYSVSKIEQELLNTQNTIWVIERDGELIAHAKLGDLSLALSPAPTKAQQLHRLYVLQPFKGQGLGKLLLDEVICAARLAGTENLYLGVWSENFAAQKFYFKHGFVKIGEYDYPPIGDVIDKEWILLKEL